MPCGKGKRLILAFGWIICRTYAKVASNISSKGG